MADVYDRWHKSRPKPGEPECGCGPGKVPTKDHGCPKRWQARWRDEAGRQRKENHAKQADAARRATNVAADLLRGQYVDPRAGRVRLRPYAEQWLAGQTTDPSTRETREREFRLHIAPALGDHELRVLAQRPSLIQNWLRGLSTRLAANSVRHIFALLNAILAAAHDDELITRNPCRLKSVRPPSPEQSRLHPWPAERVTAVREALPDRYQALIDPGAGCGLRQGEVFGLAVDDVVFLRGVVHVRRQVKIVGNELVFAPPKHGKERDVPLPETGALRLAAHLERWPAREVTLPWREPGGKPVTVKLLFTTRQVGALHRGYINAKVWKPALVAAEVIPAPEPGETYAESREHGFHALRHYYASALLADGVDIRQLAALLGHADPAFTLRIYCHLMPGSEDRARAAAELALRAVTVGPSALDVPSGGG